jgi:hypothetical protein
VIHHVLGELALEVEDVVADAEDLAGRAGIIRVLDRAAALVMSRSSRVFLRPKAHRDAQHLVACLLEQAGSNGGVNSPGHGNDDAWARHSGYNVILRKPNAIQHLISNI